MENKELEQAEEDYIRALRRYARAMLRLADSLEEFRKFKRYEEPFFLNKKK